MRCAKYFKSNQLAKYVENFSGKIFFLRDNAANREKTLKLDTKIERKKNYANLP